MVQGEQLTARLSLRHRRLCLPSQALRPLHSIQGGQPAHPQYANCWAPLTRKQHILPHPAQPQHTNHWAPQTRKRHQQEHRPQRPTERSDPPQHAKGRPGDCPGPRKGATTWRNVTQGGGEVSRLRVGNFTFQIGHEISLVKSRGFCESSRTPAADTVDSCGEGLFAACALLVYEPHFVLSIGVPLSLGGPNLHRRCTASPSLQSPTHQNISGSVREICHTNTRGFREISHSEIYHREFDLARNSAPPCMGLALQG